MRFTFTVTVNGLTVLIPEIIAFWQEVETPIASLMKKNVLYIKVAGESNNSILNVVFDNIRDLERAAETLKSAIENFHNSIMEKATVNPE